MIKEHDMTLTEAIEQHHGKSHSEILSILRAETVEAVGSIRGDNLRNVVAILAVGLQYRLDNAADSPLRTALLTGFKYMALPDYAFNLAADDVAGMLAASVGAGLVSAEEHAALIALATYQKPKYPCLTMRDIVAHINPELCAEPKWQEFSPGQSRRVRLKTDGVVPPSAVVLIQYCESDDGENWTAWRHATAMTVVDGFNFAEVPHNGLARRMRWRGADYAIGGVMVGV